MLKERCWLVQFFLIHLCLIVPILMASVLAVSMVTDKMKKQEAVAAKIHLDSVICNFEESYSNYKEESILLSDRPELWVGPMTGEVRDTRKGIELLQLKQYCDSQITNVFIDYGNKNFYSSAGVSEKKVHLGKVLGCRQESIVRGLRVTEGTTESVIFLYKTDVAGYMMYSYPVRRLEEGYVFINFIISFEQMTDLLQLSDENQWYMLQALDGSTLSVGCNALGEAYVLTTDNREERMHSGKYMMTRNEIPSLGMTISLYSEKIALNRENGLYQMQLINMFLIMAGVFLSAVTSWALSRRRMKEILCLEEIARGNIAYRFSEKNVYKRLQDIIVTKIGESREQEIQLRDQTAYLIFYGNVDVFENINEAFRRMGFSGCPERFFVGAVSTSTKLKENQLPAIFNNCMRIYIRHNSLDIMVFLQELDTEDGNMIQRRKLAESIRNSLREQRISNVRIGMSQMYTDPAMINGAYNEAISVLEHVISGNINDYCGCWENVVENIHFLLPEDFLMKNFTEALEDTDFEGAQKCLHQLVSNCSVKEYTAENQEYVRYTIVQLLVEYFRRGNKVENAVYLKECVNINIRDERKFVQAVEHILKQSLVRDEEDAFVKMLNYVEKNFYRSDLSYEDVASVGGVTKTYVSKLFRAKLGVSYIEYLTLVRMDKASILLRTTDYSINDIVKIVGYENAATFRRAFKERYGISATDYRKREN